MLNPCPACQPQISINALQCPHCGEPIKAATVSPNTARMLEEYARQYKTCIVMMFVGFISGFTLIGLGLAVYAMVQQQTLRRRVVELGADPDAWEAPLKSYTRRIALILLAVILLVLLGLGIYWIVNYYNGYFKSLQNMDKG